MAKKHRRAVVALTADQHINSTVGLLTGPVALDDGGTYMPSKTQIFLARNWRSFWADVESIAGNDPIYAVFAGDLGDRGVNGSTQVVTKNETTIIGMCIGIVEPVAQIADYVFIIRGTEAHTGQSASIEEAVARDIKNCEHCPDTGAATWFSLVADWGGAKFDGAHHFSMGSLPWTEHNAANKLASETIMRYAELHEPLPAFVYRAHCHGFADSGENFRSYGIRAVNLPAWTTRSTHGHKVAPGNRLADIGGVIVEVEDGRIADVQAKLYRPATQTVWREKTRKTKS